MHYIRKVSHFFYRHIFKPIFFIYDPEDVHDRMIKLGEWLSRYRLTRAITRIVFSYSHSSLEQKIWDIHFPNPIGLAAGFDKDARIYGILDSVGFGFGEIGTVTLHPYEGNSKPRLYRLPKSKGIVVYYGLKNIGARAIIDILKKQKKNIPQIISIGRTNCKATAEREAGCSDYRDCLDMFHSEKVGDIYEINISCPNTFGGEPFTAPEDLDELLRALHTHQIQKPIVLKMPINLPWEAFQKLLDVAIAHNISAVNIGNLNKNRDDKMIKDEIPDHVHGAVSGKPTFNLSNELISRTYEYCGNKLKIIGTGGIFCAEDAYEKIKRGASFVELITGMIYEGPQLIGEINHGLVRLLKKDGYENISEAVGAYHGIIQ